MANIMLYKSKVSAILSVRASTPVQTKHSSVSVNFPLSGTVAKQCNPYFHVCTFIWRMVHSNQLIFGNVLTDSGVNIAHLMITYNNNIISCMVAAYGYLSTKIVRCIMFFYASK